MALINYPIVFDKAKETVIAVFVAIIVFVLLWTFIRSDNFSKKWRTSDRLTQKIKPSMHENKIDR
jgi:hypothetical protein